MTLDEVKSALREELQRQHNSDDYDALGYFDSSFGNDQNDWVIDGHVDPNALAQAVLTLIKSKEQG